MNTALIKNMYKVAGKAPVDAKALIKTYNDLLLETTWEVVNDYGNKVNVAYNGMITAVWLDEDSTKNGIYFLQDTNKRNVSSVLNNNPDVTKAENWIKLCDLSAIKALETQIADLNSRLEILEGQSTETFTSKYDFPQEGIINKLYIDAATSTMYFWSGTEYVSLGVSSAGVDYDLISGGNAQGLN